MNNKIKDNKIIINNLNKNHGITIGNSIRRILLTSIKGYAISAIKISNVKHEYQSIKGIYEDINNIILNIKQIILKGKNIKKNKKKIHVVKIKFTNENFFLAGDIEKFTKKFKVINKKFIILNFSKKIKINIKLFITYNYGYIPSNKNILINKYENKNKIHNLIKIDSIYTPIKNVSYFIKDVDNNKEKLFIKIITNNTLSKEKALYKSICILLNYYKTIISNYKIKKKNKISKIFKINFKYFKFLKYFNNENLLSFIKKNGVNNIKKFKNKYKFLLTKTKNKFLLKLIKKIYLKYKKYETFK
ncbi:MAG: hypothetical protein ABNO60_00555 [Candidatus Shikimatogenerans sp. Tcar]|uniref:DNA-directed RNA polymerase RpoA/D/Rpb3-type domain-containing protein n=1 Tax=Candidatus Shikimatogenerans sp. Tcar TaxID=3158565 RepID=A0AAU7QUN5_9FLAO